MLFNDCVLDIETSDTDPARGHILQIAAIKFSAQTGEISTETFDRCLLPLPNRRWDEGTRNWWMKRKDVLQSLLDRMEEPKKVLEDLRDWAGHDNMSMWGKPTHFDHSFLASFYRDLGMQIPFNFRRANDMNSFIRGAYWPEEPPAWEKIIEFKGAEHNAIDDCWHQLRVIFKALKKEKPPL